MLEWQDSGIVLSLRRHGEAGGIVSLLTRMYGRSAGYVYGASSAKKRALFEPGNVVAAAWQAKAQGQLGSFALEMEKSPAADVMDDALKLTALQSACALADATLPEGEKHEGVFDATLALLSSFSGEVWPAAYIYWEIGLLRELGFGLDLSKCAATGTTENLIYVSPKSGSAVSDAAGAIYKEKLLRLPSFLRGEGGFTDADILDGLKMTGHFLLHRVFSEKHTDLPEPRLRLEEKYANLAFSALETA